MKLVPFLLAFFISGPLLTNAQIRVPQRTTTQNVEVKEVQTTTTKPVPATVRNRINTGSEGAVRTSSFTMPDGNRVNITLRENPKNLPQNFGGSVKETVVSSSSVTNVVENCVTEVRTISANSSTFMNVNYNQQAIHIYPGAIYRHSEFFAGNYKPVESSRNPITIRTDNLANTSGPVTQTIQQPNAGTISTAISNIITPFSTSSGSSNLQYRIFNSENDADLTIKLSAGGGYASFKASASVNFKESSKKYYLTVDVIKSMYTITSAVPASGFFSDPALASNKDLIVLNSVTYGTRLLANVEVTIENKQQEMEFKASFGADSGKGISANAQAAFNYLRNSNSANSQVNVFIIGGPLETTTFKQIETTTFDKNKLLEQISELISKCNYQSARPIAYSFTDLNGNILGIETASDKYIVNKCTKSYNYQLTGASVQFMSMDDKMQGSNAIFSLFAGQNLSDWSKNRIVFESPINNTTFSGTTQVNLNPVVTQDRNAFSMNYFSTNNGGFLDIFLEPLQVWPDWDKWKFSTIQIKLEFRDPDYGTVETRFIDYNTNVTLEKNLQRLRLPFDGNFKPGSPFLPQ